MKAVAEHEEELPLKCLGEFVCLFTALLAVYLLQLIILSFCVLIFCSSLLAFMHFSLLIFYVY